MIDNFALVLSSWGRRLGENYSEVSVETVYRFLTTDVKKKLEQR